MTMIDSRHTQHPQNGFRYLLRSAFFFFVLGDDKSNTGGSSESSDIAASSWAGLDLERAAAIRLRLTSLRILINTKEDNHFVVYIVLSHVMCFYLNRLLCHQTMESNNNFVEYMGLAHVMCIW
jgi:hypothetical protein